MTRSVEGPLRVAGAAASRRSVRRTLMLAHLAGAVTLGGVQGIVPALPAIQAALSLSDAQIGLVNSVYLLPSVILAIPAGLLMDRIGRRPVLVVSLVLFGAAGALALLAPSFEVLLVLRALQGIAFASALPLSVTLIGDLLTGIAQVREQGVRMVVLTISDVVLALVGGALVVLSWNAPFAIHLLALPLAVLVWLDRGTDVKPSGDGGTFGLRGLARLLRTRLAVAVQSVALIRFFFKFALLTYAPVLLFARGWSSTAIAVGLAVMATAATLAAVASKRVLHRWPATTVLAASLVITAACFVILATLDAALASAVALLVLGLAEGSLGVVSNAMVVEGAGDSERALFVASSAALKNLGKFAAPALLSAATLVMPLTWAFLAVAGIALATLPAVVPLRQLDDRLAR